MQPLTSTTHPLRVDFVDAPEGRLGMTFAPGKKQPNAETGAWARDLSADLRRLQNVYGAGVLVSIIEARELRELEIPELAAAAGALGMRWIHLSVPDGQVPADDRAWVDAMRAVRASLGDGDTVVVHCRGGLGRTGTFAASVLASYGVEPAAALSRVREARPKTVENPEQEAYVARAQRAWRRREADRVRGCLVAGAVGDALGAAVEFDSLAAIRAEHGAGGVREIAPAYGKPCAITDDTQMTLFTAEGLLRARSRGAAKGICDPPSMVELAYFRWLWTQGEPVPAALSWAADGWLFEDMRLHSARAPGNTCLGGLRARLRARLEGAELPEPINDSKGCGGVMRVAPVGLVAGDPFTLATECAALTHGHPAGSESAGLLAEIIGEVMAGHRLGAAAPRVWQRRRDRCHPDTRTAIDGALALVREGAPPTPERLETLGGGWVGEEALAISLYCALACPDLESALSLAVTHSGDSDSTGAIAGNLLGADLGVSAIPDRWLADLELADVIDRIAEALTALRLDGVVDAGQYPGH